jgi:predicted nicotinamide N-methyase
VPEIRLRLAAEMFPIWRLSEDALAERGVPPPYWAFAWAGGQALARYILDHPEIVTGKTVADFGTGSGLAAIAAAKAGAARALAADIDLYAVEAARLNAAANAVAVEVSDDDWLGVMPACDVLTAGDMCFEKALSAAVFAMLRAQADKGVTVLLGDPGRAYLPKEGLAELAVYEVATSRDLEDAEVRRTRVFRVLPSPP